MVAVLPAGAVVAGLMALLFLLAWAQWGNAITNTLNVNIPIIGNALGRLVSEALEASYLVLLGWFDGAVTPVADFIIRPIIAVESIFDALNAVGQSALNAVIVITTVKIPAAVATSFQYSNDLANYLQGSLGNTINYVQSTLNTAVQAEHSFAVSVLTTGERYSLDLVNYVQGQFNASIAALSSVVSAGFDAAHQFSLDAYNASVAFTQTAYNDAVAYANQIAARADNELAATATAVESYALTTATAVVGAAITDIDNTVTASLAAVWPDISAVIPELEGVIGTRDADILDALGRIDWTIPGTIAEVASLAGVTALTLARYLKDCGIPNCQNLSALGRDISALTSLVGDATFLALLVELVEHPADAAGVVESTFGGGINDTISLFKTLVSI